MGGGGRYHNRIVHIINGRLRVGGGGGGYSSTIFFFQFKTLIIV